MKLTLLLIVTALASFAAEAKDAFPAEYQGGSLALHHSKVRAVLGPDEIVFVQGRQRISLPADQITAIACGTENHRRFGLLEGHTHYVALNWVEGKSVLFRLDSDDYDRFLAGLERLTGKKAVDTSRVPTAVRYGL